MVSSHDGNTVTLPQAEFERLLEVAELAEDLAAADATAAEIAAGAPTNPHAVVVAEMAGDHPLKAWRKARGFTIDTLSAAAGVSVGQISMIENRKRVGTIPLLRRLAKALDCTAADLVEEADG